MAAPGPQDVEAGRAPDQPDVPIDHLTELRIARGIEARWPTAVKTAAAAKGATTEERLDEVRTAFSKELGMAGLAIGGVAATPGIGTGTAATMLAAETSFFMMRSTDLVLTVAAIDGHSQASVEERRAWVLSVLMFGDAAANGFARLAGEMEIGLGGKLTNKIPAEILRQINRRLGRTILTKYRTKRGAIALGKVLPFGIGAVIGGSANVITVRALVRQADQFFSLLGDSLEVVPSVWTASSPGALDRG